MTDAQLKKLAKENNIEPTYELLAFARLVLINAKIQDLKLVAINTRLAVDKEREACAVLCETECAQNDGITCAEEIRARGDVHTIDISQERVDETAKYRHEWVGLTKAEFEEAVDGKEDLMDCWMAIEAKLKEKNT